MDEEEKEDRVPKIYTDKLSIYVRSHGENKLDKDTHLFETFTSPIDVSKFTACGLCDFLVSSHKFDYFIPIFINEIERDYKRKHPSDSIFNDPKVVIEVMRYIICKLHPELTCRMGSRTIEYYDDILSNTKYIYPLMYAGPQPNKHYIKYEPGISYNVVIKKITEGARLCATNMYKHTARHNLSRKQRNKLYTSEKGQQTLDITCLTPYYNQPYGIKLKRGDSLLQFFYKYKKRNKRLIEQMIAEFDPEGKMTEEYDFKPVLMSSVYKQYPQKNISSISLKFLLFFFEKIGIRNLNIVDFSCGGVDENKIENRKQGWTDSSSASPRSSPSSNSKSASSKASSKSNSKSAASSKKSSPLAEIGMLLKDAAVEEKDEGKGRHGKSRRLPRRRITKKSHIKKRRTKKRFSKKNVDILYYGG